MYWENWFRTNNINAFSSNIIALKEKNNLFGQLGKKTELYSRERKSDWYQTAW